MAEKRNKFLQRIRRVAAERLVFLDESGANLAMGRTHAWVLKGKELADPRPMNWGKNLTMLGAIRMSGWVTLNSMFNTTNKDRFVSWVARHLAPKLRVKDVVVLDNLSAHHDPRVRELIRARGAAVVYLPPYSPDLNPIEPVWALVKKDIRKYAPRHPKHLRRCAQRARYRVTPNHCASFYAHAGYRHRLK